MAGDQEGNMIKPRYDITMSKRTRKPPPGGQSKAADLQDPEKEEYSNHKSLKQLINGSEESDGKESSRSTTVVRNSLGQHFTEEEEEQQLRLVRKQHKQEGMKLKGMVERYVSVLSQLMKMKRDTRNGSRKKPLLRLAI